MLAIVVVSTLVSLRRGFVREALSLVAWVLAFVVSLKFSARLSIQMEGLITNEALRDVSAYVILFAATLMLGSLVNTLLAQIIRVTGLTSTDRALGTVFGLARGLVIVLVLVLVMQAVLQPDEQEFMRESRLLPHLAMVEEWARELFADVHISSDLALPEH